MPEDQKNTGNDAQAGSNTEPQTSTSINPPMNSQRNLQNPVNNPIGNGLFPVAPRKARMRFVSNPRYRIRANFRQDATVLMNEIGECTQKAVRDCYSQKTFTQAAYAGNMQKYLANPKITVVSYGTVEKIDQFGNPWEDWMDAPNVTAGVGETEATATWESEKKGFWKGVGDWLANIGAGIAEVWKKIFGAGNAEVPELATTLTPIPMLDPGWVNQWELKSQVNADVLKFTQYSDGRCIAEVILPKEKGRPEDQHHVYTITDSLRALIDNPENAEYGLDKAALRYINYGKDAFDEYYKNGKIFPPLTAGSDEYYTIVLHNMMYGKEWVKDWKQTFANVAAFNIIAGAVISAVPSKGTSGGKQYQVDRKALKHSSSGDFTTNPKTGKISKMKGGGHGQSNIEVLDKNGMEYNVTKTYDNGVRIGNVPGHKVKSKRAGSNQSWFPENWQDSKITKAGEHVANMPKNLDILDGQVMYGEYEGVRVGVIKTDGKIGTIFPDATKQP